MKWVEETRDVRDKCQNYKIVLAMIEVAEQARDVLPGNHESDVSAPGDSVGKRRRLPLVACRVLFRDAHLAATLPSLPATSMATSTTSFIDAVVPQSLVVALRDDNLTFFKSHEGFTRQQLHGHRVGSAYRSVKSFVTAHRGSDLPDFGDRLHLYANLLWKEMVRREFHDKRSFSNIINSYSTRKPGRRSS